MNASVDISNVIIETKRLIIRPWKSEDLNDFYEYASVDGVGQMAGWNTHKSKEESQEILKLFIEDRNVFALELKTNRKVIGSIGLEKIGVDLGEPYTSLIGREIGYVLSKEYWGQSLMPEAVMSVMDYCYKDLNCEFLQCSHAVGNEQSKRVIEKVGFQYVQDYERTVINGNTRKSKVYVKQQPYETQS
ncbi:MAG: GNAT family N-acetyltransferase [Bacillota bacterium]|nr:GNAT family N-acetyltransferase [Bacillota bacterium]